MDTVGTVNMWKALSKYKILTCLHKFVDIDEVISAYKAGDADPNYMMISSGITDRDFKQLQKTMDRF